MEMTDIQTLTREKIKLDEPGLYDVVFLNDDITTTDFVVRGLNKFLTKHRNKQKQSCRRYTMMDKE